MELTQHLYLRIGSDVRGPMSASVLHKMFKEKKIDNSAMFSFDGSKWASITKLFSSKAAKEAIKDSIGGGKKNNGLKIINPNNNISEIPQLVSKTERASKILQKTFAPSIYLVFAMGSVAMSTLLSASLRMLFPEFSSVLHIALAIIPSMLFAAVVAHGFGNLYIRKVTGLSIKERYSLAIHMPWENAPEGWSLSLKKWLYCGDWLVENDSGDMMPYVRAFVTGKAPVTIDEEVDLWQNIMQGSKKRFEGSIGHSVRELACLERLPAWTTEITPGMNLHELEKSLGTAGHKWAVSLLKRAASRRGDLKDVDLDGDLSEAIFEFYSSKLGNGRECLMVIISSHKAKSNKAKKIRLSAKEHAA